MKEKKLPLVSIVVPSYNHDNYVKETIVSIINQTYNNIELIVIDDGSKDNSVKVIQKLADKYGFTFIYRPNKGLSATLNEGIKLSKGKYFCACASDDIYMLDKIEKQVKFMEKNPEYSMCYGKIVSINTVGKKVKKDILNAPSGWIFEELIFENKIPAPTQLIKKSVFEDVGYYDTSLFIEDWDMWLRIAQKYKIGYLDEYLAYYRRHDSNNSSNVLKMYQAQKSIIEKYLDIDTYDKIISYWNREWFNLLAKKYKKESLVHLAIYLPYLFTDIRVLKGLLKFIIPSIFFKKNI